MVATDGIYFTTPHPSLNLHPTQLGAWEETFKPNMTQLMPGVYWDDKTREAINKGGHPKLKSRGINAKDLAAQIDELDYLFSAAHASLANGGAYEWPTLHIKQRFMLESAKMALQRNKWHLAGKVYRDSIRVVSSNPQTKRVPEAYRCVAGYNRTPVYPIVGEGVTTPYHRSFGYHPETDSYVDRDGDDGLSYWREIVNL